MLGDAAEYKAFPVIRFNQNTTNNIVVAGHPGYLLNGTFRDPTSNALQRFTNIGTVIGDKVYSIIYYSPAETYPVYRTIYLHMIKSFEVIPQNSSAATSISTYENRNYGILIKYPSDWSIQESTASGTPINVATFVSPTGPDSDPTADISIYLDKLHNLATTLNNYAHFVAFADYENRPSYFHAFKLLELSTNSSILAGKPAYALIGTYQNPSAGLQKLMEIGTIIGDKITREIVNRAIETDSLMVLGKLKGLRSQAKKGRGRKFNRKVSGFPYFKFAEYLTYKAALAGIKVINVFEDWTSQTCRKCSQRGIRKTQGLFICKNCGEENADRNAAFNIAYLALGYISKIGVTVNTLETFPSVDRNAMMRKEARKRLPVYD
jgi:IS605 OrfB family transposase